MKCTQTLRKLGSIAILAMSAPAAQAQDTLFHDSHFHLTNYIQEGTDIGDYLEIMGDKIGRSTLFGIPLQQTWSYENSGDFAPTYYLHSDAPLYYYSFTDAFIANAYLSLDPDDRQRFDPMITGFNPADMYAADHIRRVLETYPGVFSGIGEFTIHKEFVSSKVAGDVASLTDPALDRILEFAGEVGLVVIIHSDIDVPFANDTKGLIYLKQMVELLERHPETTVIWAHAGLGRVIAPVHAQASVESTERSINQFDIVDAMIRKPELGHVYFDISWSEVAKYAVRNAEATEETAKFLNTHADRILFGTDNVAPSNQEKHLEVYHMWDPIWERLDPEASLKIRTGNYERLFDTARKRVRDWESRNISTP
jgi:predicted TIM-barrel fold metal-dependent hydrolase